MSGGGGGGADDLRIDPSRRDAGGVPGALLAAGPLVVSLSAAILALDREPRLLLHLPLAFVAIVLSVAAILAWRSRRTRGAWVALSVAVTLVGAFACVGLSLHFLVEQALRESFR